MFVDGSVTGLSDTRDQVSMGRSGLPSVPNGDDVLYPTVRWSIGNLRTSE